MNSDSARVELEGCKVGFREECRNYEILKVWMNAFAIRMNLKWTV